MMHLFDFDVTENEIAAWSEEEERRELYDQISTSITKNLFVDTLMFEAFLCSTLSLLATVTGQDFDGTNCRDMLFAAKRWASAQTMNTLPQGSHVLDCIKLCGLASAFLNENG